MNKTSETERREDVSKAQMRPAKFQRWTTTAIVKQPQMTILRLREQSTTTAAKILPQRRSNSSSNSSSGKQRDSPSRAARRKG